MQSNQTRDRFSRIEQCVDVAAQACRDCADAPEELRKCLDELGRESNEACRTMDAADGENDMDMLSKDERIRLCVDRLQEAGSRVMQASRQARHLDQQLQVALNRAHQEISALKQRFH